MEPLIVYSKNPEQFQKYASQFKASFSFNKTEDFKKFVFASRDNYFLLLIIQIEDQTESQQIIAMANIIEFSRLLKNKGKVIIKLINNYQIDSQLNMQTLMKANSLIDITTEDGCLVFEKQLCETNSNLINFPRNLYKFEENHLIEALQTYECPIQIFSSEEIKNEELNPFETAVKTTTEVTKIDEKQLLEGQPSPSITAPIMGIKSAPCANCTCGRNKTIESKETVVSKCGRCGLGDEFRCTNCPFKGQPAFNSEELKEESQSGLGEKQCGKQCEKKCGKLQTQEICSGQEICKKQCGMCPNKETCAKEMCQKKDKCETCPNKMNCPFNKNDELAVKIGEKVEVEIMDQIKTTEIGENVATKILETGQVKLDN